MADILLQYSQGLFIDFKGIDVAKRSLQGQFDRARTSTGPDVTDDGVCFRSQFGQDDAADFLLGHGRFAAQEGFIGQTVDGPHPGPGLFVFYHHDGQGIGGTVGEIGSRPAEDVFIVIR